jgi:hypothetical protein
LGRFLRACKSGAAAKEVEDIAAKLAAFKDYKLKAFGDLLVKAEEYARLGPQVKAPPKPRVSGKGKAEAIDQGCLAVLQLYNQAIDPSVTLDQVEVAVKAVQDLGTTKTKLEELAGKMGIVQKFGKKDDVLKAIRQKILSVKGTWDRRST